MGSYVSEPKTPFQNYVDKRQRDLEAEGFKFPTAADRKDLKDFLMKDWLKLPVYAKNSFRKVNSKSSTVKEENPLSIKNRELQAEADETKAVFSIFKLLHPGPAELPLPDQEFVIIGTTTYVQLSHSVHMPAEVGMVAFSLQNGIVDNLSALIDPGRIPKLHQSYPQQAEAQSKLLRVPVPPYSEACRDYKSIWNKMTRFMHLHRTTKSTTFLFCKRSDLEKVKNCLDIIKAKSEEKCEYEVFPLEMLFQQFEIVAREMFKAEEKRLKLRQHVEQEMEKYGEHEEYPKIEQFGIDKRIRHPVTLPEGHEELFPSEHHITDYLESHYLRFVTTSESLACPHHMVNYADSIQCPLKLANLNALRVIDCLIDYFGILPLKGAHCPLTDQVEEKHRRRRMVGIWGDFGHKDWKGFQDSCYRVQPLEQKQEVIVPKSQDKQWTLTIGKASEASQRAEVKHHEAAASQMAEGKRPEAPAFHMAKKRPEVPASLMTNGMRPEVPASQMTNGLRPETSASKMVGGKRPEASVTQISCGNNPEEKPLTNDKNLEVRKNPFLM